MKSRKMKFLKLFICSVWLATLAACGSSGGGGGDQAPVTVTGTLATALTDSSSEEYRAIYVTVDQVEVQFEGADGWQTVASPAATYNLLELVNGVKEQLGIAPLDAGHYNQLRLILGSLPDVENNLLGLPHPYANYLIDQSDEIHELKIPSGFNTGIKIVHGFDISENQTTDLLLDFDAMKSVVKAGNSGKHLLKPTIKVLETADSASVTGRVSAEGGGPPATGLEGVLVSAQGYENNLALDPKERVSFERSTLTAGDDSQTAENEAGQYALFLPAGTYNLVAYSAGYQPVCQAVTLSAGMTVENEDFSLVATLTGTVEGTVSVSEADADQSVTIDFLRSGDCTDLTQVINVKSVQVGNGGTYSVALPAGNYQVVTSTSGKATQTVDVLVTANAISQLNPAF